MNKQASCNLDAEIGYRIRQRRKLLGYAPQHLANLLGVSYQQLYKYENGENRLSAAMLKELAKILHVDVSYFFKNEIKSPVVESLSTLPANIINEQSTLNLVKHYLAIPDLRTRDAFVELMTSVSKFIKKKSK